MKSVYVVADNILSPLGRTTEENFANVSNGQSGIGLHDDPTMSAGPFYAAMMKEGQLESSWHDESLEQYTKFEQLVILSVQNALDRTSIDITNGRTAFIVSTTKGNIELLEQQENPADAPLQEMELFATAKKVAQYFNYKEDPIVVSNACISGLLAILTARRLILSGRYDHAVVTGADVVTRFVLSGFQSFQAVSSEPCRPFDAERKGVTLGEGAATVILTSDQAHVTTNAIRVGAGAVSNDANHISGPSRTGAELSIAMQQAMKGSGLTPADIGFVSAHGTATLYNDEMESKALHLAGLLDIPVNSLKGYYGHTLGAAGLIEAVIGMHALQQQVVIPTLGFRSLGVPHPVKVSSQISSRPMQHFLKTVSGFGGCNAAMIFSK
ncbi:beta-ketoacyl-[acyl-carrier-protein] synthase family protein [Chitinophaga pinensis]|uniref:Beta-ketoacyl synthase n=1 Tax=Chitinophaga pinensis (strain ATCC 43595 / DSM 2588 / LMG 13176 / NBRC 15968 / NCIMB 11800 / UQM 2034) TaxID=485918 RepID=A0A979G272_CHIPD|nr:beta-ketoacyl synthase N-terminal-like domain-containing protein [Chitinophaga pinensis]ACU59357.1 Beta-ketoacyl synthase [Chitinophaga pinensis DSM 2588]